VSFLRPIVWPLLVGALTIAVPGWSQSDPAAMAEALFNQGREAFDAEDYDTACARFRESDRIDPQPGTKLNLARCEKARGRIATAWALYRTVLEVLARDDDRREVAQTQVDELEPRLPRLTVTLAEGTPQQTVVRLGEIDVRPDGFGTPLPVDPGPLRVITSSPGHEPHAQQVDLAEGERAALEVSVGPAIPKPPDPTSPPPPAADPGLSGQAVAGWSIGAVGLTALLAGGGTGIGGLVRRADGEEACSDELMLCSEAGKAANDDARALLYATTGLWIAGGVAAAVGLTLVLTSGDDEDGAAETVTVETHIGPRLTGMTWTLRF